MYLCTCGKTFEDYASNHRVYCSKTCCGKNSPTKYSLGHKGISGENNYNWKGGIKEVRKRFAGRKRLLQQRRNAWMRGGGKLTIQTVQEVYEENIKLYGTLTCIYCLQPITFGNDTLEHKHPLSRGGTNIKSNLAIACRRCNISKNNKTEVEYGIKHGLGKRKRQGWVNIVPRRNLQSCN